jgi:two-component system, NarL family, sensor histidine kinase DesK
VSEALEPLRRSTRNTLAVTTLFTGVLPVVSYVRDGPNPVSLAVLTVGLATFLVLYLLAVLRAIKGPWAPIPLTHSYGRAGLAIALACVAATIEVKSVGIWGLYTGLAASEFLIDRPTRTAWRHIGIVVVADVAVVFVLLHLIGQTSQLGSALGFTAAVSVFMAFGVGTAYRQWEGALKLEEARRDAADLAATRERLRLAEDLHDILGHALEVVSLKSELAVRLSDLDPERSKAEMTDVQRLARGALKDVRELAHSQRPTDFAIELDGARHLLTSAGITCDFDADPTVLTERERELFGRILRETVTNALRHADPGNFEVTLSLGPGQAALRVLNDGVVPDQNGDGTGLKSLARHVAKVSGEFTAGPAGEASFEVRAVLPR